MAAPLALDPALAVLTLRMTARLDSAPRQIGSDNGSHRVAAILRHDGDEEKLGDLAPERLGLPSANSAQWPSQFEPGAARLPPEFIEQVRERLSRRDDPNAPLWLDFQHPIGTLPLAPWEYLLREIGTPVARLAYHPIAPACAWGDQELVLCISAPPPQSIEEVGAMAALMIDALTDPPEARTLHLFSDAPVLELLQERVEALKTRNVRIYDPAAARELFAGLTPNALPEIQSPWLQWIGHELGGIGIDGVHFLCPPHRSIQHGMLIFSENPAEPDPQREFVSSVGPQELARFLTLLGAWSVGIAPPLRADPPLALRLLADQIARSRVGTALLHGGEAQSSAALPALVEFLYAGNRLPPPRADSHPPVLYCHPAFEEACRIPLEPEDTGATAGKAAPTAAAPQPPPSIVPPAPGPIDRMPAWQLSVKRSLERSTADLLEVRGNADQTPAHEGVSRALEFIARLVESKDPAEELDIGRFNVTGDTRAPFDSEEA